MQITFQVPEELFQKIKEYLQRNNMTQKEFVIELIENEIKRNLTQREVVSETQKNSAEQIQDYLEPEESVAVSDFENPSKDSEGYADEQDITVFSGNFKVENGETESKDESEDMGMTMEM